MPATTNILVPLDGSELAEEAVDVAIDIAHPAGGKLTLFVAAEPEAMRALTEYADSEEITSAMAPSRCAIFTRAATSPRVVVWVSL